MIRYDVPVEVSWAEYRFLMHKYAGILAGRSKDGRFYVKCWNVKAKKFIESDLKLNEPI